MLVPVITVQAQDKWTFKDKEHQRDSAQNEIWLSSDRPGAGTGSEIIDLYHLQWETGFEAAHYPGIHSLLLPTTLFRFGVHERVEMRMEFTGTMNVNDHPDTDPTSPDEHFYSPSRLWVGSKIKLWDMNAGSKNWRGVPRTSLMVNLGLPVSSFQAQWAPISGAIDLLCEHEVLEWFSIGYDLGVYWVDWAPTPDVFAALSLNFEATDRLGLFVESYNGFDPDATDISTPGKTYTHCDINLDFGITYAVHPRVQLDIYSGFNLYNDEPVFSGPKNNVLLGLGVTWLIYNPKRLIHHLKK